MNLKEKLEYLSSSDADYIEGNLCQHSSNTFGVNKYEVATHENECKVFGIRFQPSGFVTLTIEGVDFTCRNQDKATTVLSCLHQSYLPDTDVAAFIEFIES